ncbi:Sec-independent protein translocase protein TatB [Psychrobacter sp. AOP22-C1-C5]|uniref:Sec-independent protein translocase protein TatB n=1 Tax=Psychrobacter sp. AOP22-C1-C5 TaxID=3457716 RepID=UPI0040361161
MFDIGFSELLLFGVIALIVLGPEKLPQAARTAGQWYAKIRRTVSTLQSEIEAELDLAETRQLMQKELAKIRQTEADMRREMAEMRGNMKEFENSQNQHLKPSHAKVDNTEPSKNDKVNANLADSSGTNNDVVNDKEVRHQPAMPKEFDYAYETYEQNEKPTQRESSLQGVDDQLTSVTNNPASQFVPPVMTRPWENMWFRLGAYDKARRLPMPPYLPNYKADTLLNSHADTSEKLASLNKQEAD